MPRKCLSAIERLTRYRLAEGDLVIARRGELGRSAVITKDEEGWLCGTGSFFIRPKETLLSEFLYHAFCTRSLRGQMEKVSGRATMPSISNRDLKNLKVSFPTIFEQQRIVEQLDALSAQTERVVSLVLQKLDALAELKQSLLHQAFTGQLTNAEKAIDQQLAAIS